MIVILCSLLSCMDNEGLLGLLVGAWVIITPAAFLHC